MMEVISSWLLGITGAAILAAVADGLIPPGPIRRVGKMVCGLVLLVAVLRPVIQMDGATLELLSQNWQGEMDEYTQRLQEGQDQQMKLVIEGQCSAYIVDKAAQLGAACQAKVSCIQTGEGIFLPQSAHIVGEFTLQQQQELMQALEEDLGLLPQEISFTEEDGS